MEKSRKKSRLFTYLFRLGSIAVIVGILSLITIDISQYNPYITARVEDRLNGEVHLERLYLKLFPLPFVTIEGLTMYDDLDVIVAAPRATLVVSPLSLVKMSFQMRSLTLHKPQVVLRRLEDGSLNFIRFIKRPTPPRKLKIERGNLIFSDGATPGHPTYEIGNISATATRMKDGVALSVRGKIFPRSALAFSGTIGKKEGELFIEGEINLREINSALLNPYIAPYLKESDIALTTDLKGDISYRKDSLHLKGEVDYRALSARIPSLFTRPVISQSGSARIAIDRKAAATDVAISAGRATLDDITIKGGGSFHSSPDGTRLDLRVRESTLPLAALEAHLRNTALPAGVKRIVDDLTLSGGTAMVNSLNVSAPLGEPAAKGFHKEPGAFSASITLRNTAFSHRRLPYPVADLSGDVAFEGSRVTLHKIRGGYGSSTVTSLTGTLDETTYRTAIKADIDGEELTRTIKTLIPDKLPPSLEKMVATGPATVEMSINGARGDGKPATYRGTASLRGAGFLHPAIAAPLHSLFGTVTFDHEEITLSDVSGRWGEGALTIDGRIGSYRSKKPHLSLDFSGSLSEDALRALGKGRLERLTLGGTLPFKGTARTVKGVVTIDARLDGTAAAIDMPRILSKERGFPLTANLLFAAKNKGLTVEKSTVLIGRSAFVIKGDIRERGDYYSLAVTSGGIDFNDLDRMHPALEDDFDSSGTLALDVRILKRGKKKKLSILGEATVEKGSFKTRSLPRAVSQFDGGFTFFGDSVKGDLAAFTTGDSSFSGEIVISNFTAPRIDFSLTSPHINLKDLTVKKRKKGAPPSFFSRLAGEGKLSIEGGQFYFVKSGACDATLTVTAESLAFSPLSCALSGGRGTGTVTYFKGSQPALFSLDLTLNDVHLDTFLSDIGIKGRILSGAVSGSVTLNGRRWVVPLRRGFDGQATLASKNGKLWRFLIINKIFSVVNIISIDEALKDGLPYKLLSGTFDLKDGTVVSEDLFFDSDSMRASAIGSINLPNATIDASFGMHPFVTIDKIITTIPLVGWIIGGEEKSTVKMYYEIKGPLKKPDVYPLPVKSIGKSTFGIFERLLEAPVRIVDPFVKPFTNGGNKEKETP